MDDGLNNGCFSELLNLLQSHSYISVCFCSVEAALLLTAAASLKVLVCASVCSDGSGHAGFDGGLHPAVFHRHDGGYDWDAVHYLHV